jgi:hypothetical protein
MKVIRLVAALMLLALVVGSVAEGAEPFAKVGTLDGQFLKIPVGARPTAMGGAYVAVADDAMAIYWNPAGLARLEGSIVSFTFSTWPAEINMATGAYVFHLGFLPGMLAVNARGLYMSSMDRTTVFQPDGDGTTFDAGYSSFGLSYARSLTDKFSVGGTVSLVHGSLDDLGSDAISFDLGTIYDTGFRSLRIGMAIFNMGTELSYLPDGESSKLPITFRVGAAIDVVQSTESRLTVAGDFSHPPDNVERMNLGGEYGFKDFFFMRGGYNFSSDSETWTGGVGVQFPTSLSSETKFDYSYTNLSDLGGTHRFSLEIDF